MEAFICTYVVGVVVSMLCFAVRHHLPWGGMPPQYGLVFLLSYVMRITFLAIFWPITLVTWAIRGFPAAPYDLRLLPDEAIAQGKRA